MVELDACAGFRRLSEANTAPFKSLADPCAASHMCLADDIAHDSRCSYAGMPISEVFSTDIGLGGVLSLLWFRRRLPDYATKFIEMILMVRRWNDLDRLRKRCWGHGAQQSFVVSLS